jgi:hypothetical protein
MAEDEQKITPGQLVKCLHPSGVRVIVGLYLRSTGHPAGIIDHVVLWRGVELKVWSSLRLLTQES